MLYLHVCRKWMSLFVLHFVFGCIENLSCIFRCYRSTFEKFKSLREEKKFFFQA